MTSLALMGATFVGTFFWPASPEAAVALYVSRQGLPLVAALLAAAGQGVAYLLLLLFGEQIRRRWGWFARQCERVRARYQQRLTRSAVPLTCASGLVGLPPSSTLVAIAPGIGLDARWVVPLLVLTRVVRFAVIATAASKVIRLATP